MLAPILGVLAMLAGALTVWLARTRPATEHDPDAPFWYCFAGACVLAPLILGAALLNKWFGLSLLAIVVATALSTNRFSSGALRRRLAGEHESQLSAERSALAARHELVLGAWCRYELDPGAAIEHPGMNDVRHPETSALAKALAVAERLRDLEAGTAGPNEIDSYRHAVVELESSFRQAEGALARTLDPYPDTRLRRVPGPPPGG